MKIQTSGNQKIIELKLKKFHGENHEKVNRKEKRYDTYIFINTLIKKIDKKEIYNQCTIFELL